MEVAYERSWGPLLAIACFSITLGCGSNSTKLKSLAVAPSDASANGSTVIFSAIATLSDGSQPGIRWPVQWYTYNPFSEMPIRTGANIDGNGNATCDAGATGAWTIYAVAPADKRKDITPRGENAVIGTAQFSCP